MPFNGKMAYMYLMIGKGAYREKEFDQQLSYVRGFNEFQPKSPIYRNELAFDLSYDDEPHIDLFEDGSTPETNIDGINEYGYGFWFRYLTTRPKRLYSNKPAWMALARFTVNENNGDIGIGDRTLAIFIGKGFYHFTTYNLRGQIPNVYENVNYGDQLEGVWTFFYYSYGEEIATAWVVQPDNI